MRWESRQEGACTVLICHGAFQRQDANEMRAELSDLVEAQAWVVVDMSGVDYIDTAGVAVLVEAHRLSKDNGTQFALAGVCSAVMDVLHLVKLDGAFAVYNSLGDAPCATA